MLKFIWLAVTIILAASLVRTLWFSYRSQTALKEKETQVQELEAQTKLLEEKVQQATSSFALEKRVREELKLHKDGEAVIKIEP